MRLKDKVVVVTGGGRGIGRAIALAHAAEGARVAVLSRTESDLEETVGLIAGLAGAGLAVPVDLVDYGQVESAFATIARELGPVDVLINNAGNYVAIGPVWEVGPDEWWRDVEVNVRPTYNCCRVVLPVMIARGGGRIINLIGGGTAGAFAYGSGYAVGKSGVMRLTECLTQEVADSNIAVLAMAPGLVRTAMTDYQRTSDAGKKYLQAVIKRLEDRDELPPERAADLAVAISTGRFDRLTGRALTAWDDLDRVEASIDDFLTEDKRALRVTGLTIGHKPIE